MSDETMKLIKIYNRYAEKANTYAEMYERTHDTDILKKQNEYARIAISALWTAQTKTKRGGL